MKLMGIDYGDKKIGIALSDDGGAMAFPKEVIMNDDSLLAKLVEIIKRESVDEIVLGESRNFKGDENPIMKRIKVFKVVLEELSGKAVVFEPELLSTQEASRFPGRHRTDGNESSGLIKNDASAATIILQSYIDRTQNK